MLVCTVGAARRTTGTTALTCCASSEWLAAALTTVAIAPSASLPVVRKLAL